MFYCFVHNWYSSETWCPMCHPATITSASTELPENKSNDSFQWTDELVRELVHRTFAPCDSNHSVLEKRMAELKQSHTPKPQAENKPDRDWEIVAWDWENDWSENKMMPKTTTKIKSVKRKSDGEVFSVGDEVVHYSDYYTEKIKEFIVPEKTPWQMWFHPERNPTTVKSLSNFNKLFPQKLFTTEEVEKTACDFIHYTEFVMDDDGWLDDGEMKSMSQVYKEFTQWKNKKQ